MFTYSSENVASLHENTTMRKMLKWFSNSWHAPHCSSPYTDETLNNNYWRHERTTRAQWLWVGFTAISIVVARDVDANIKTTSGQLIAIWEFTICLIRLLLTHVVLFSFVNHVWSIPMDLGHVCSVPPVISSVTRINQRTTRRIVRISICCGFAVQLLYDKWPINLRLQQVNNKSTTYYVSYNRLYHKNPTINRDSEVRT